MTKVCVMKTTDDERFFKRSRNQKTHAIGLFFAWKKTKILTNSRQSERREFWFNSRNSFTHVFSRKERGGARRNTDSIASLSFVSSSFETESERKSTFESGREREREKKRKNGENDFGWWKINRAFRARNGGGKDGDVFLFTRRERWRCEQRYGEE